MTNITDSFGFLSWKLAEKLEEHFERAIGEKFEMKSREVGLMIVVRDQALSQIQIGQMLKLDKNTVRFLIDELEKKQYVYRMKNENNRRENIICLTEQGKLVADEAIKTMSISENEVLNVLTKEEKSKLNQILKKFYIHSYERGMEMKAVEVMKEYLRRAHEEGHKIPDMYAEDGVLVNFKGETFKGKEEIRKFYDSPMPKGFQLTIESIEGDDTKCVAIVSITWENLPNPIMLEETLILENDKIKSFTMMPK